MTFISVHQHRVCRTNETVPTQAHSRRREERGREIYPNNNIHWKDKSELEAAICICFCYNKSCDFSSCDGVVNVHTITENPLAVSFACPAWFIAERIFLPLPASTLSTFTFHWNPEKHSRWWSRDKMMLTVCWCTCPLTEHPARATRSRVTKAVVTFMIFYLFIILLFSHLWLPPALSLFCYHSFVSDRINLVQVDFCCLPVITDKMSCIGGRLRNKCVYEREKKRNKERQQQFLFTMVKK